MRQEYCGFHILKIYKSLVPALGSPLKIKNFSLAIEMRCDFIYIISMLENVDFIDISGLYAAACNTFVSNNVVSFSSNRTRRKMSS